MILRRVMLLDAGAAPFHPEHRLAILIGSSDTAPYTVGRLIDEEGVGVSNARLRRPRLHDVFVRHTGHVAEPATEAELPGAEP